MKMRWWEDCVVYQIYPRSFQDSNGDGIGDLRGILKRLDYLSMLGIDAIWISPIFISPMADYGYDISDYRSIDPIYGTLDDVDLLLKEAHARNIKIIFDMVLNHTSIEHPWFIESRKSKTNDKSEFYIWSDTIPNNWQGAFGGKAWTFDEQRGQYYMHSFLKEQPDLNWRKGEVVDAVFKMLAFWLDRGIDGFRLDVINCIVKDETFRNNPKVVGSRPRPYDMQRHIFDRNRPETHARLRRMRKLLDSYPDKMMVGEIMVENPGEPELASSYLGRDGDELHLAFDFSLTQTPFHAQPWKRNAKRWSEAVGINRVPTWVLNNHDTTRLISRLGGNIAKAKLAALFLLTQRGAIFLYYGEEIGLPNSKVPKSRLEDPLGKRYWPFHPGRDPERGPMIWSTSKGYGFSDGKSWLPFANHADKYAVENQMTDKNSMLSCYRELISLRKGDITLKKGITTYLDTKNTHVMVYIRKYENQERLVLLNFSSRQQTIEESSLSGNWELKYSIQRMVEDSQDSGIFQLQPWQGCIYIKNK